MLLMDEMRYMRLYGAKRKVYIPFNPKSKKKGAAIMLLTKDSVDSHTIMNLPYIYNPGYYESLYIDRNITAFIDSGAIIDEDEGEVNESAVVTEAIIHNKKKPGDITILYDFVPGCTPNDISVVKKFYNEARVMHWLRYFKTNHRRIPESLTIHCYPSVQMMAKDCLPDALERQEVVLNSWSDEENIFIVAPRGFKAIEKAEGGNYTFYTSNELITWAAMRSSPACSRQLACYVGTALSGRMTKKMMDKVDDNYGDVKDNSMAAAWAVKCLYDEEGDIAIRQLVKSGDVSILTSRVVTKYAGKAWSKLKPIIYDECAEQRALTEGYIIPGKDIESNTRLWLHGHNILFVTGLSGSGKSTTARAMAMEMDAHYVELDLIEHAKNFLDHGKHNRYDMAMIQKYWDKYKPGKDPIKMSNDEFYSYFDKVWKFLYDDMKSKKDELFVVEGLQIVRIANKVSPEIVNEPMIVKGTSALQSMIRRYNRQNDPAMRIGNSGDYKCNEKGLLGNLKDFFGLACWYYDSEGELGAFRTKMKGVKQESVLTEGIFSSNNVVFNFGKFGTSSNILYIIGSKGSDMKTLANSICESKNAIPIDIDMIKYIHQFADRDVSRKDQKLVIEYSKKNRVPKDLDRCSDDEFDRYFMSCYDFMIKFIKVDKKQNYVIYGTDVIGLMYENKYANEIYTSPLIILDASMLSYIGNDLAANGSRVTNAAKGTPRYFIDVIKMHTREGEELKSIRNAAYRINYPKKEAVRIPLPSETVLTEDWKQPGPTYALTEDYISDGEFITFFNGMDSQVITEAEKKYDSRLKKWLFKERLKNNKMVLMRYQELRAMNPDIKYTFLKLPLYHSKNIWIDLSYYHGLFLKNMVASKTNAVNIYWDFLNRLIIEKEYSSIYEKITIFIPCWPQAWGVDTAKKLMDYKVSLNPISMILRMLIKNPNALKKWGDKDIVFMAPNGYFKINFNTFNMRDMAKFKKLIERLAKGEAIESDEDEDGYTDDKTDTDTPAVITTKITDKIEKNMGIKLDDITGKRQDATYRYDTGVGDGQSMEALDPPASDFTHLRMRAGRIDLPEKDRGGFHIEKDKKLNSAVLIMGRKDTQAIDVMASDRIGFVANQAAFYKPTK